MFHPKYDNYYIDTEGIIYGPRGVVKTHPQQNGYLHFTPSKNNVVGGMSAHRFIKECELGHTIFEGLQVNHIDGNKHNNHPDNLEICTRSENMRHAMELGLHKPPKGEKHGRAKLTDSDALCILRDTTTGIKELAILFSVSERTVRRIKARTHWKHLEENIYQSVS